MPTRKVTVSRLRVLLVSVVAALATSALAAPAHAAAPAATGTIEGTLTTAQGEPVAGAYLQVKSSTGKNDLLPQAWTDAAGHYSIAPLLAGRYRVGFYFAETLSTQWVPKAARESAAKWFTVRAGETTIVDESLVATGGLEITMRDGETALPEFCVEAIGTLFLRTGCTTTGTLVLTGLPIDTYVLMATAGGSTSYTPEWAEVTADTITPIVIQQR